MMSADNPPVLLKCGHVMSSLAMNRILRSSRLNRTGRFKCPTCPREMTPAEVIPLQF
jgi:hypothetical protein